MNKQTATIAIVVGLLAFSLSCLSDDGAEKQSKAVKVTSKAMDSVKNVVNKGAQQVDKAANGITVKVERFVNPEPHQEGQSNILVSAGRGLGRLVRNVTLEVGRSVNSLGSGAVKLVKSTAGAAVDTARQAARRIGNPRGTGTKVEDKSSSSESSNEAAAEPSSADAEAPAELEKTD